MQTLNVDKNKDKNLASILFIKYAAAANKLINSHRYCETHIKNNIDDLFHIQKRIDAIVDVKTKTILNNMNERMSNLFAKSSINPNIYIEFNKLLDSCIFYIDNKDKLSSPNKENYKNNIIKKINGFKKIIVCYEQIYEISEDIGLQFDTSKNII